MLLRQRQLKITVNINYANLKQVVCITVGRITGIKLHVIIMMSLRTTLHQQLPVTVCIGFVGHLAPRQIQYSRSNE
jgi:hypothetical protein